MLENPIIVVTIIVGLVAVGELISVLTRAYVPSLLVAMVLYFTLLWTGVLPANVLPESAITVIGGILVGAVITHMGTLIPISVIKAQWKAIAIAVTGAVVGALLLLAIVGPLLGYPTAVAGAGPITGGIIAYLVTADGLTNAGFDNLVVIAALTLGLQAIVGMPIANFMLRKYSVRLRNSLPDVAPGDSDAASEAPQRTSRFSLPEKFQEPSILLFLLLLVASVANFIGTATGINYSIYCLIFGILLRMLGILPEATMQKANSFGFGMVGVIAVVLAGTSSVTFDQVVSAIGPTFVVLIVGAIGVAIGGGIMSKLLKWDVLRGMPVALTALFGFPGDYLLCQEIARSVGRNERERKAILEQIYTPMLIGGFATVTTSSIVIASILVGTL